MKKYFIIILLCFISFPKILRAQYVYGTTGLLHMPTADMQRDKTFMVGGSFLDVAATPEHWNYDTYNYYINIAFLPWLEVGYTCTLHKITWPPQTGSTKFRNQDRQFSVRLRAWKEGWWKEWTPQIVVGVNDPGTSDIRDNPNKDDYGYGAAAATGNGHWNRYYIAATKHFQFQNWGELGVHAAYVYNKRIDYHLNGPALGANFRFGLPETSIWRKAANGVNLMMEYDSRTVNCGMGYSLWDDRINAIVEWTECKHVSGGIIFKVYLK